MTLCLICCAIEFRCYESSSAINLEMNCATDGKCASWVSLAKASGY